MDADAAVSDTYGPLSGQVSAPSLSDSTHKPRVLTAGLLLQ